MSGRIAVSQEECAKLEERARSLAQREACLELLDRMMTTLSDAPGLDDAARAIVKLVVDHIGGTYVALYYRVGSRLLCTDVTGASTEIDSVHDAQVRAVFERRQLVEETRAPADTQTATPDFARASDWAMPLLVCDRLVGVLKAEAMLPSAAEVRSGLRPFFNYAALVLKNAIDSQLQEVPARAEAERAAASREEPYRTLLSHLPNLVVRYDRHLRRTFVNRAWEEASGLCAAEVVGVHAGEIPRVVRPVVDDYAALLLEVLEDATPRTAEFSWTNARGEVLHLAYVIVPERDARGEVVSVLAVGHDITVRVRAEEDLRRVHRALLALSECNQALVRATDEAEILATMCRLVVDRAGYEAAEIDYVDEGDPGGLRKVAHAGVDAWADSVGPRSSARAAIASGQPNVVHAHSMAEPGAATGASALTSCLSFPLSIGGKVIGALSIASTHADAFDAAELRLLTEMAGDLAFGIGVLRARAAHAKAEAGLRLFRQLVDQATDAILVVDLPSTRIVDVNEGACRLYGHARDALLQLRIPDLDEGHQDAAAFAQTVRARRDRDATPLMRRHRHRDGSLIPVEINGRHVVEGEREYLIAVVRDLRERIRTEAKYRLLFEESFDALYVTSPDGHILDMNKRGIALFGYTTKEEVLALDLARDVYADPADRARILAIVRAHETAEYDTDVKRKDGTRLTAHCSLTVARDDDGQIVAFRGILRDVTEQRRAEEALRRSERQKTILNAIANVFLTMHDDELYARVLDEVLAALQSQLGMFGFIAESGDLVVPSLTRGVWEQCQVADKTFVFPPSTWGTGLWGRAIREQRTFCSDGPFHTPAGHVLVEHCLAVPIVTGADTIGLLSVANGARSYTSEDRELLESIAGSIAPILDARRRRDWQEQRRKRAEETLRKLSRAVEQSPASLVITDTAGKIEYVNPKFTEIAGYTSEEVLGENPRLLKSGEMSLSTYEVLWRTITAGKTWHGEFHNRKKSGELFWALASISPITDADGKITHYVAVAEDITARKGLEDQLRQAQKMEAVGQLAGGVAHDFNNILTATLMTISLLLDEPQLTDDLRAGLEDLDCHARRAASLTRQLLLFSRRQTTEARPVNLNEVVTNLSKMLRRLIGEDIDLAVGCQSAPLMANADPGMLEQVLMNLCVNARDAMPRGGSLSIATSRVVFDGEPSAEDPEGRTGSFICLSVTDSGCGMDDETKAHIFEPFFTTKGVGRGTGLGLATVYGIVNEHRGWVQVESAVGRGAVFRVYLPARPECTDPLQNPTLASVRGGTETILLVEDDVSLRRLATGRLRSLGYTVFEAGNGGEALTTWGELRGRVDLLLTDMVMPGGMTGLDLAERLVQQSPGLRIILVSGYNREKITTEMLAATGITFVAKPYDAVVLAGTVRACLDRPKTLQPRGGA